jgi:hypothetical protein
MTIYKKEIEKIYVDWLNDKSIKQSEIKQRKLENQNYACINTVATPFSSTSIYKKIS